MSVTSTRIRKISSFSSEDNGDKFEDDDRIVLKKEVRENLFKFIIYVYLCVFTFDLTIYNIHITYMCTFCHIFLCTKHY